MSIDKNSGYSQFLSAFLESLSNLYYDNCINEFIWERSLSFRWDKFYSDTEQQYEVMLKIIFELMDELKEDALLLGSGSEELCVFREDEENLLNNESGIWDWNHFKDIIAGRSVVYTLV